MGGGKYTDKQRSKLENEGLANFRAEIIATQEFVVPKSIPIILLILSPYYNINFYFVY